MVTDAHVSEAYGNVAPFFQMLNRISTTQDDVVFLGDIFELWIGMARYEGREHAQFLNWCLEEKKRRTIGFVEGNHEFFVVQKHKKAFTWSSDSGHLDKENGRLFVHGDLINRDDRNYLRFRRLSKNLITKAIVRFLPRGPHLVNKLKLKLKTTNQDFRMGLPREAIDTFAKQRFQGGIKHVVVGHFHQAYEYSGKADGTLIVLPDWYSHRSVTLLRPEGHQTIPWQEIS